MIVWIDLEASGLRAAVHAVLEVAAIVTDDRLHETGRFHRVVHWEGAAACAHLGADVTTLNELAKRLWPELHGGKPHRRELHRALPDIEDSLTLGRYYAAQIARMFSGSTP